MVWILTSFFMVHRLLFCWRISSTVWSTENFIILILKTALQSNNMVRNKKKKNYFIFKINIHLTTLSQNDLIAPKNNCTKIYHSQIMLDLWWVKTTVNPRSSILVETKLGTQTCCFRGSEAIHSANFIILSTLALCVW